MRRFLASVVCLFALSLAALAAERGYFGFALTVDADGYSLNPTLRSIKIDQVTPGSPAAKAGLAVGDLIVEVQGIVVAGAKSDDLKAAMQKTVGRTLRLKIQHGSSEPFETTMTATAKP